MGYFIAYLLGTWSGIFLLAILNANEDYNK